MAAKKKAATKKKAPARKKAVAKKVTRKKAPVKKKAVAKKKKVVTPSTVSTPARHRTLDGAIKAAVLRARREPLWFFREYLQVQLDPWQVELVESVADILRFRTGGETKFNHEGLTKITVRAMHGPGKTFGVASLMHWFGFCFRGLSPCTAPKLDQLKTRLFREYRKLRMGAKKGYDQLMEVHSTKIEYHGDQDWGFVAETGREPENMAGYHDDCMLIVVDEASGVDEAIYPVLEGAMSTGTLVVLVMIGNPTRNQGTFHDSHRRRGVKEHYCKIHVTLDKAPRVSRKWVSEMESKYGKDSPVVKVRCYGEFADVDDMQLIALDWIDGAFDRDPLDDGSHPRIRVAVDVADGGLDDTVITVGRRYNTWTHVVKQLSYNFPSSESPIRAAEEAEKLFFAWGGIKGEDELIVDAVGVGAGTAGALMKKGHRVIPFKGGQTSSNPKRWTNRRVQAYYVARDELRDGRLVIDAGALDGMEARDELSAQLCSIKMRLGLEKVDDLEPKSSLIQRGIKSPDRADSLVMLYADETTAITGGVARGGGESAVYAPESEVTDGAAYLT